MQNKKKKDTSTYSFGVMAINVDYEDVDLETTPEATNINIVNAGKYQNRYGFKRFEFTSLHNSSSVLKDYHAIKFPDKTQLVLVQDNLLGHIVSMVQLVPRERIYVPLEYEANDLVVTANYGADTSTYFSPSV